MSVALDCSDADPDTIWTFCHFAARLTTGQVVLIDPPRNGWKQGLQAVKDVGYDSGTTGHRLTVLRSDLPLPVFGRRYATPDEASRDFYGAQP